MTEEEDTANAASNERIRACRHSIYMDTSGQIHCAYCKARWMLLTLPRLARPRPIIDDDVCAGAEPGTAPHPSD